MRRFIGLMSGTSLDAIDAAAVELDEHSLHTRDFASQRIDESLHAELEALQSSGPDELARAALAANALADRYAQVVAALLASTGWDPASVVAIGAHGQTVRHRPELGYTIQLLNAARLAERCGIAVVADLRAADVAAGGQGAPLVPAFHASVFGDPAERRAVVNLGGIANVSLLPAADEPPEPVRGFDTGPANTLLDAWCRRHTGRRFDDDGNWARAAPPDAALLDAMLEDPYFAAPPPKSTGRDHFHLAWLERALNRHAHPDPRTVQATLVELTAVTVARACLAFGAQRILVCGGGARNSLLMQRLAAHTAPAALQGTEKFGIDPQAVEAAAFAWLAAQRIDAKAGNLPAVTGARGPRVLGTLADPRVKKKL